MTKHRRRKSYNPFVMWGSYVGALAGMLSYFLFTGSVEIFYFQLSLNEILTSYSVSFNVGWTAVGFFIGWGIHSLFRRLD